MITLAEYYQGRDTLFWQLLGTDLCANAGRTVETANALLVLAKGGGVVMRPNHRTGMVRSGWRPPMINETTPGAAKKSLHLTCEAIDLEDPQHELSVWCFHHADTVLRDLGLWLEHPDKTPTWCHVQLKPPLSNRRVFFP